MYGCMGRLYEGCGEAVRMIMEDVERLSGGSGEAV